MTNSRTVLAVELYGGTLSACSSIKISLDAGVDNFLDVMHCDGIKLSIRNLASCLSLAHDGLH